MDEVVREAPWVLDDSFLTKHKIDFVAHDDVPYTIGSGTDIYAGLKEVSTKDSEHLIPEEAGTQNNPLKK